MNKYMRISVEVPTGVIKSAIIKLMRRKKANISFVCAISPLAEITIEKDSFITIGSKFRQRSGSHIRVRKNAELLIGNNVSINHNCMVVCHKKIEIGNDVMLSPNVMIYDHDHDFRAEGGVKSMKYKNSPIKIGNNVWIGANSIILRGSIIGDNSVIAAGSIVKGIVPDNSVYIDKKFHEIESR